MSTPAGWYQDPTNAAQLQYWDGTAWTGQTSPAVAQAPPAAAPAAAWGSAPASAPAYGGGYAPAPYAGGYGFGAPIMPPALAGSTYADYGARVGGYLLDFLFIVVTIGIGWIVNWFLLARDGERNGQTIGKQVMNIRVAKEDGTPMTVGDALMRELVVRFLLFGLVGGFFGGVPGLLDLLWPLWDERKQALHDKICSTYVIKA